MCKKLIKISNRLGKNFRKPSGGFFRLTLYIAVCCGDVQGGELSWAPLLYAVPLALNTEAILHSNNTRDADVDREAGIVTLAILAGRTGSYVIFALLLFTPYIVFALLTANASRWFLLPLLTVMFAFNTERQFRRGDLTKMPQAVAVLNFKLAVAYVAACAFTDRSTLPGLT